MADQLVSPEELASYVQSDLDLATAELLIETATGVVQAAAGQSLIAGEHELFLPAGPISRWLVLPERPVTTIFEVTADGTDVTGWSLLTDAATGQGRLYRAVGWWSTVVSPTVDLPPQIKVTYQAGYALEDSRLGPARAAVLRLAGERWSSSGGSPVTGESIDDYRVQYAASGDATAGSLSAADRRELHRIYGLGAGSAVLTRAPV